MNRRQFLSTTAKAVGVIAVAGSVPLVLGRPHYSQVLTLEYIEVVHEMHAEGRHCGSWTASEHLQWVADWLARIPTAERDRLANQWGLALPSHNRIWLPEVL